jgi:GWxTD domain-containing protein
MTEKGKTENCFYNHYKSNLQSFCYPCEHNMPPGNINRLPYLFLACLLFSTVRINSGLCAEKTAQSCYEKAAVMLAHGDSSAALGLLDRALALDSNHGLALLKRGRLHLSQGKLKEARGDFTRAGVDNNRLTRSLAHLGLGDIFRRMPNRNWQAVQEYHLAIKVDSTCCEAYYALAQTGFALEWTEGYRLAGRTLAKLICLDPGYLDAYSLWREKIRDQPPDELKKVGLCIEQYIADNPRKSHLWLDLARDRFALGEVENALAALDRLKETAPKHKTPERFLLRARCLLDVGDTLGFEKYYDKAIKTAEIEGGFRRLFLEVQPIFTPEEKESWYGLRRPKDVAVLFRKFWKRRDPDPISVHNERLVSHYLRLREAENHYYQRFPHSRFQTSRQYFQLLSPGSSSMEFDPELLWNVNPQLPLDQRGMVFIRHGPPDELRKPDIDKSDNPAEVWFYGGTFFSFERVKGAGDFLFVPTPVYGAGNIKKALETESFNDPLPAFSQDYYGACFHLPDGRLELACFQSAPAGIAPSATGPEAVLALYDSTWVELALDRTNSTKVKINDDSLWLAANSVRADPGSCFYAVRMNIPGHRAVDRKSIELINSREGNLDLSDIVLGSPPTTDRIIYRRGGINILPRPSRTFRSGVIITVYLEVYGLKQNREGEYSFFEKVTVTQDKTSSGGFIKSLKFWGKKQHKSLGLAFERSPSETAGPVPEHFEIDTSNLVPGTYRLQIEVLDSNSGQKNTTVGFFKLTPPKKT